MTTTADSVTIRRASLGDGAALARLATLDSARPLAGDVLVAESRGRIVAALSQDDRRAVADPFTPTADLVALLRVRADRLGRASGGRVRPFVRRLLPA